MARNPKFDDARRKLDEALSSLDGPAGASDEDRAGRHPGDAARPSRVAPRRRPRGVPLQGRQPAAGGGGAQTIRLDEEAETAPEGAPEPEADPGPKAAERPAADGPPEGPGDEGQGQRSRPPATEALTRLVVGAALLGLDGLEARSEGWAAAARIERRQQAPAAAEGEIGSGRFRHALVGWVFETEERLRPRGNPISWLRAVVSYSFGTVFAVAFDLLPLPRLRRGRGTLAEPTAEETRRWAARGQVEEERSRRFARAALEDMLDGLILYLARRPAVGRALVEVTRSPAMDDAVRQILAGPAVEQAIRQVAQSPAIDEVVASVAKSPALDDAVARVAQSPAIDEVVARVAKSPALDGAVSQIVRTPAMEDAVTYLVGTRAMNDAIDTLAKSPALVDLVTTQSTSVAAEILEEVRERGVSADKLIEGLARRLLRRPPRSTLPLEARGLLVVEHEDGPEPADGGMP